MDSATLASAIREAGCPTLTVTVLDGNNRATWSFVPDPAATQPQIDAGNNVIATIPIEVKTRLTTPDFIGRFTNAEYRSATGAWRQTAGNAKNWDVVVFEPVIDLNRKKVDTLKTSLVADGILTQTRADEIFQ